MPNCEQRISKYKTYDNCMAFVDAHRSELDVPYEMAICAQCFGLIPSGKNIARTEMGDTEYSGTSGGWIPQAWKYWSNTLFGTGDISGTTINALFGLDKIDQTITSLPGKAIATVKAVATSPLALIVYGVTVLYVGSKYIGKSKQHLGVKSFVPQGVRSGVSSLAGKELALPSFKKRKPVIIGGREYHKIAANKRRNRR